jgi:hypothetical protein
MSTHPSLKVTVTHNPDNTYEAMISTLGSDSTRRIGSHPIAGDNAPTRTDAIDSAVHTYRLVNHLPSDTPIHAVASDKMRGALTPSCPGDTCICQ